MCSVEYKHTRSHNFYAQQLMAHANKKKPATIQCVFKTYYENINYATSFSI